MTRHVCPILLAFCTALATPARADSQPDRAERQEQYARGHAAMKRGDLATARALLTALWREMPTYDVASVLATIEHRQGHLGRAANFLVRAIALAPPREASEVKTFRAGLAELAPKLAKLRVTVSQDGAVVLLDGEEVGTAPLDDLIYTDPGDHTLEARFEGAFTRVDVQNVAAGETRPVELRIPIEKAPAHAGSFVSTSPLEVTVTRRRNWVPAVVSGGLGLIALGTGTYFLVARNQASHDANRTLRAAEEELGSNPCAPRNASEHLCVKVNESRDDFQKATRAANVSFALGGVFILGAFATYLFWPKTVETAPYASLGVDFHDGRESAVFLLNGAF